MLTLIEFISQRLKPFQLTLLVLLVVVIFIVIGVKAYKHFKDSSKKVQFSDVPNEGGSNTIQVLFFHVDWCAHCVKATPLWKSFCDQYNGKTVNGYVIDCLDLDCSDDSPNKKVADTYKDDFEVSSFPTVILLKGNEKIDFDAKVTKQNLEQAIEMSTK